MADLTLPQRLVRAAAGLPDVFTANELVVAAWRSDQKTFGLAGFADQHPDSNRVLASIMGKKGLVRRGLLEQRGQKRYSLSAMGRKAAGDIQVGGGRAELKTVKLSRAAAAVLTDMFGHPAYTRWRQGLGSTVAIDAAREFFRCAPAALAASIRDFFVAGEIVLDDGRSVSEADLKTLAECEAFYVKRFGRRLETKVSS